MTQRNNRVAETLDTLPVRTALATLARELHQRGWMAGTAGNLSAMSTRGRFWITASGLPKGRLQEHDFLEVGVQDGRVYQCPRPAMKPSAETAIHRVVYDLFDDVGACLHVHTVDASLISDLAPRDADHVALPALEMLKGLGIWDEHPQAELALFDNLADVSAIAAEIGQRFRNTPPQVPALLIRGHGVTVWGERVQQAYDRLECLEFLLSFMARRAAIP